MALLITANPNPLILSGQPVAFTIESDETATPLRISGGISGIGSDSVPAVNHAASFELSDWCKGLVTERGFISNTPQKYLNTPYPVKFDFAEFAGSPPVAGDTLQTGLYYLLDGYIPRSRQGALYSAYSSLFAYMVGTKNGPSWFPGNEYKKVLPAQYEFINFLQLGSQVSIDIILDVYLVFTDKTTCARGQVFSTVEDVGYMEMVYFPVGIIQLGIPAYMAVNCPGKTLESYQICVKSGSSTMCRTYFFKVDYRFYQNTRQLWVKNSFGLWEALLCTGLSEQVNEYKTQSANTDGTDFPDKIAWKIEKTDTVKTNTGYLPAAQMAWLSDLLHTTEAFELQGSVLQPIVFKDLKIQVAHDTNYQFSADIEYEYAYYNNTEQA